MDPNGLSWAVWARQPLTTHQPGSWSCSWSVERRRGERKKKTNVKRGGSVAKDKGGIKNNIAQAYLRSPTASHWSVSILVSCVWTASGTQCKGVFPSLTLCAAIWRAKILFFPPAEDSCTWSQERIFVKNDDILKLESPVNPSRNACKNTSVGKYKQSQFWISPFYGFFFFFLRETYSAHF